MCNRERRRVELLISVAILVVFFCLLAGTSCEPKREPVAEREPPVPETPSSNLEMPAPVTTGDIAGEASVPDGTPLGFAADLDGKLLTGHWDVHGQVRHAEEGKITFLSDERETGHFVYRLPAGLAISLHANRSISLKRSLRFVGGGLGYDLVVSSSDSLVLASSRLRGSTPRKVRVWRSLTIEQTQDRGSVIDDNKYGTTYLIPVVLKSGHQTLRHITAEIGTVVQVSVGTKAYSVLVMRSCETVPSETHGAVLEDAGFGLEYIVIPEQSP